MDVTPERIAVLTAELADQIAAGEVVERPASVVKELVENAVDAGARRVDIELTAAGLERILVCDDGRGIVAEDLPLAITRHATSKVQTSEDLVEVRTLGFRGEALASMAAVAHVTLESRPASAKVGTRMRAHPGLSPTLEPVGMPLGTRVEVARLFANVPVRRKFLRSEATEVGHCSETVLRLAISHPAVHLRLQHNGRVLLDLPAAEIPERMLQVLARRATCPLQRLEARVHDVGVLAFLGPPEAALRSRHGLFVVVRRRVVQHRELAQIVEAAYGESLPSGRHPVACILVDPPPGTVDVNVHPQKAEVRFSEPQRVYAAVREALRSFEGESTTPPQGGPVRYLTAQTQGALDRWGRGGTAVAEPSVVASGSPSTSSYRLRTRAAEAEYGSARDSLRRAALDLHAQLRERAAEDASAEDTPSNASLSSAPPAAAPERGATSLSEDPLTLLTCLPGPVALFRHEHDVLAVDLQRLRSHLVYRRLCADLGGGQVHAQGLLEPVLIQRTAAEVAWIMGATSALARLGVVVEAFGEDMLRIRAVPAQLRDCVEQPDVADLIERLLPWVRLQAADPEKLVEVVADTRGAAPAPRLARRWLRELLEQGVALDAIPGVRRWTAEALIP